MKYFAAPVEKLIEQFERLPGIGYKTAQRLAFFVLALPREQAEEFAQAILEAKNTVSTCKICQNLTDSETCSICSDPTRDHHTICVVTDPKDVIALERTREYHGLYHVLHGAISPLNGIGPEQLRIKELLERVADETEDVTEVIMAQTPIPKARPRPCIFPACSSLSVFASPALPMACPWAAIWNMRMKSP